MHNPANQFYQKWRGCFSKQSFSRDEAREVAKAKGQFGYRGYAYVLEIYRCPHGTPEHWHLTKRLARELRP